MLLFYKEQEEVPLRLNESLKENKAVQSTGSLVIGRYLFLLSQCSLKKLLCILFIIVIPISLLCFHYWSCVHLKNDMATLNQTILLIFLNESGNNNISSVYNDSMNYYIISSSTCHVCLLAITLFSNAIMFYKNRRISEQLNDNPIRFMEIIWLFSAFGYYILIFFTLMAITSLKKHSELTIPFMVDFKLVGTISQGFQIAFQVIFFFQVLRNDLLQTSRDGPRNFHENNAEGEAGEHGPGQSKTKGLFHIALKMSLFTLFIFNLGYWLISSFVEFEHMELFSFYKMEHYKEAHWKVIGYLMYPLGLYFRFYSAINFLTFFKVLEV